MGVPRSVSEVSAKHVTLEVEGIDRMYLNLYVPQLQREVGVASFFRYHRGNQFASSARDGSDQQGVRERDGVVCEA